jgi:UDP-hydrolysing UDP-N-acetyl-D-glucosamine 2-epimerase
MYWLIREVQEDPDLILDLVVTGTHLSKAHGYTIDTIRPDGFPIGAEIDLGIQGDSPSNITAGISRGLIGFSEYFRTRDRPDLVVLLGDRYELLCPAIAALNERIIIAHIAGGETSEGAIDEAIRHSLTKMATYHFPAGDRQKERILRMGEANDRIFMFGKPGLDHIRKMKFWNKNRLEQDLNIEIRHPFLLVTFHPTTLEKGTSGTQVAALLDALKLFRHGTILITGPNGDAGNAAIQDRLAEFSRSNENYTLVTTSLGRDMYLSCMKLADAVIGNSSSGLIEAPLLRVPTVDIGDRQKGRGYSSSVIHSIPETSAIINAVNRALSTEFKDKVRKSNPPYDSDGNISGRICKQLKEVNLSPTVLKKQFHLYPN